MHCISNVVDVVDTQELNLLPALSSKSMHYYKALYILQKLTFAAKICGL